jgi:hypothetical protein
MKENCMDIYWNYKSIKKEEEERKQFDAKK